MAHSEKYPILKGSPIPIVKPEKEELDDAENYIYYIRLVDAFNNGTLYTQSFNNYFNNMEIPKMPTKPNILNFKSKESTPEYQYRLAEYQRKMKTYRKHPNYRYIFEVFANRIYEEYDNFGKTKANAKQIFSKIIRKWYKNPKLVNKLFTAIRNGNVRDVKLFLTRGANPNTVDSKGVSPFEHALSKGNLEIINALIESGAFFDVNKALWKSIVRNHIQLVELFLTKGASIDINIALLEASSWNYTLQVELFLKKGANPNTVDSDGISIFTHALQKGNFDILNALIEAGASIDVNDALIDVCCAGHIHLIDFILDMGADINTNRHNGCTPLMFAYRNGHYHILNYLLSKNIGINMNLYDCYNSTILLDLCSQVTDINTIRRVIELGANVNLSLENNPTAICFASRNNNLELVQLLLDSGSHINRIPSCNYIPIVDASRNGNISIVKLLFERGADLNCEDVRGNTALKSALMNGHYDIVKFLLLNGATIKFNPNTSNNLIDNWTEFMILYCLELKLPNELFNLTEFLNLTEY